MNESLLKENTASRLLKRAGVVVEIVAAVVMILIFVEIGTSSYPDISDLIFFFVFVSIISSFGFVLIGIGEIIRLLATNESNENRAEFKSISDRFVQ